MSGNELRDLLNRIGLSSDGAISREAMISRIIEASQEVVNF